MCIEVEKIKPNSKFQIKDIVFSNYYGCASSYSDTLHAGYSSEDRFDKALKGIKPWLKESANLSKIKINKVVTDNTVYTEVNLFTEEDGMFDEDYVSLEVRGEGKRKSNVKDLREVVKAYAVWLNKNKDKIEQEYNKQKKEFIAGVIKKTIEAETKKLEEAKKEHGDALKRLKAFDLKGLK